MILQCGFDEFFRLVGKILDIFKENKLKDLVLVRFNRNFQDFADLGCTVMFPRLILEHHKNLKNKSNF
jgi:hypothetical protein